jgi:membrane protein YdbS with pleckstrin-like domain
MRESFKRKAYAIREKDVLYRTGFIIRTLHVCPFNRIQHCSVHAGPIERQYGLASISLFTSGSEGSDLRIPGLTEGTAANIREFIMQKIRTDEQPAN